MKELPNEMERNLRALIKSKYRSVREFAAKAEIPYTTVATILNRGILNSTVSNVIKICNALNLDIHMLTKGELVEAAPDNPEERKYDKETTKVADAYMKATSDNKFVVRHVLNLD